MKRLIVLAAIALLYTGLTGCVMLHKDFVNSAGQKYTCRSSGFGILGAPLAFGMQEECEDLMISRGFKPVN